MKTRAVHGLMNISYTCNMRDYIYMYIYIYIHFDSSFTDVYPMFEYNNNLVLVQILYSSSQSEPLMA